MAAIAHASAVQTTRQTTTSSSYGNVSGVSIASGTFTAGHTILLLCTANVDCGDGAVPRYVQLAHGGTAFAQTEVIFGINSATFRQNYQAFAFWDAIAGEAITLQFHSNGTATVGIDQASLIAIDLDDSLTENTDWFRSEYSTDDTLTSSGTAGASVTFTPGTASQDWLVLTLAQFNPGDSTTQIITRMERSGEAASTTPSAQGESSIPGGGEQHVWMLSRVFTLGSASNTFREFSLTDTGTAHVRLHSRILALNLHKFKDHVAVWTEASLALSATDWATQVQTASMTPTVASDTAIGATFSFPCANSNREIEYRHQLDNVDLPGTQTTDDYQFGPRDSADQMPMALAVMASSLSAAAHTMDIDASADSTVSTPAVQHRSLWAFTMELAGASAQTLQAGAPVVTFTAPGASLITEVAVPAGTPSVVFSAPAAALFAEVVLPSGAPSVVVSAPTASLVSEASLLAGAPTIILSAPAVSLLTEVLLLAGAPSVLFSAPAAIFSGDTDQTLVAGAPVVSFSAPAAAVLTEVLLQAGAPQLLLSAPAATMETLVALLAGVPTITFSPGAATLFAENALLAGVPAVVLSAPPVDLITEVTMLAGAPTLLLTAPPANFGELVAGLFVRRTLNWRVGTRTPGRL